MGYAQANLVVLPREYAKYFLEFAKANPFACPVLAVVQHGSYTGDIAQGGNIATDISEYYIYRNGELSEVTNDISFYWAEDSVGFLLGCSFSFEEALIDAGIEIRHLTQKCMVPMFKTSIPSVPAGPFYGPLVCTMRPMMPEKAKLAYQITAQYPNVHGAPVHIGDPAELGIKDIMNPEWGNGVEIREGEVPVFWPCGVTPQAAIENAKLPLVITHSPSHMFVTDVKNSELNNFVEKEKGNFRVDYFFPSST